MAGIYIHVPFCATRCVYCGFFSTTSLHLRDSYVNAVCHELEQRKDYLHGEDVSTVYFGGGTPSQLSVVQIKRILAAIYNIYNVREEAEITLEANPDDVTYRFLTDIRGIGINRLSMGVQTFSDSRLCFLRRRHTSMQAVSAVETARKAGFDNISIDLMFGFPNQTLREWQDDVRQALELQVQHLSAYSLMYEEGTPLFRMLEKNEIQELDEELSTQMYEYLLDATAQAGFEHYEISNFALPGFRSRHNSSYWQGTKYLGAGAGAHSYDGASRQYNPDNIQLYIQGISDLQNIAEQEILTEDERYNEFVFTALRTNEGISLSRLTKLFGQEKQDYLMKNAQRHISTGNLILSPDRLVLTRRGLLISNDVMSDLMEV